MTSTGEEGVGAARRPSAFLSMSLDHVDGPMSGPGPTGPGPQPRLKVTASVLNERAGKAEGVRTQFLKADDEVMLETGQVTGSLKGFATDAAVATFLERWRGQMSYVKEQFTSTAQALRAAATTFTAEDKKRAQAAGSVNTGSQGKGQNP
ncbi:type VII secretion target [Streptomyces sp. NPDC006208]|uniref:type VII secretion target n=1 Tax=Streptomyces sp. NPDC006208 TaxID=3156734 RepID=UPI0033B3E580